MNASDITDFVGKSPGFLSALGNSATFNYTATVNCALRVVGTVIGATGTITVSGVQVLTGNPNTAINTTVEYFLAKGQSTSIVNSSGAQCLISARSIQ